MDGVKWLHCPKTSEHLHKIRMKAQTWVITGASGLIGSALQAALLREGHEVRTLGRRLSDHPQTSSHLWEPRQGTLDHRALEGADVVVHLAGASVGQRWTSAHRQSILDSRVQGTSLLRETLENVGFRGTWIQASAVGYYGNASGPCSEHTPQGKGFLADVVGAWENASTPVPPGIRPVHLRLGLVFSGRGGSLSRLWPIYRLGIGAPLGSGKQPLSWIHVDDVVRLILWAVQTPEATGVFNATAPQSTTNAAFSKALARAVNRPHWTPNVPAFALRLFMGEMASLLLEGPNTVPERLLQMGFDWQHPSLQEALNACFAERQAEG